MDLQELKTQEQKLLKNENANIDQIIQLQEQIDLLEYEQLPDPLANPYSQLDGYKQDQTRQGKHT